MHALSAKRRAFQLLDLPWPTTLFRRRRHITDLTDELSHVLYRLTLAHDIAFLAPVCRAFRDAVRNALKARPFTGSVVTLAGHTGRISGVATTPDGCVITGSWDGTVKVWRDGVCVRTIEARKSESHDARCESVAVLPGDRCLSISFYGLAKFWALDGTHEHTYDLRSVVYLPAVLPDGEHYAVGLGGNQGAPDAHAVEIHHVDEGLVHTYHGHTDHVWTIAVTLDGKHIISGSWDATVKVWSVAEKDLASMHLRARVRR